MELVRVSLCEVLTNATIPPDPQAAKQANHARICLDLAETEQNGPVEAQRWAEVFIGGEDLARDPADVLATLLHEAAHALAYVRAIKDTSRQGPLAQRPVQGPR